MRIPLYYSDEMLGFEGKFPDVPERLAAIVDRVRKSGIDHRIVKPKKAGDGKLKAVHDEKYLEEIRSYKRINSYFPDEPIDKDTYGYAALSAGAAIGAAEHALKRKGFAFALTRPKGNHAGRDFFGGYSYINNVAVAVRHLLDEKGIDRAMIIDFDAHFCNGTNNIFLNEERVSLLSIHQHADSIYPYLGREKDSSKRMRYYETRLWVTDKEYIEIFREAVSKFIDDVRPDVIAVSAGFNTYYKDVFFGTVSKVKNQRTYLKMGRMLNVKADEVGAGIFGVLEGGYWIDELGSLACNFLRGFSPEEKEPLPDVVNEGHAR